MSAVAEALRWMDDYDKAMKTFQQQAEIDSESVEAAKAWTRRCELKVQIVQVLTTGIFETTA